jgi:hypothetical protein
VEASGANWYVSSERGDDANDGKSWTNPFQTIQYVDGKGVDSVVYGDTVWFGAGTYYGVTIECPTGSHADSSTVYCDSAFPGYPDASWAPTSWNAKLYGGEAVSGWILHSGSVYKKAWSTSYAADDATDGIATTVCHTMGMTDNDTLFVFQNALVDVDAGWEAYHDDTNDTLYCQMSDGSDPDTKTIIASCRAPIYLVDATVDYVKFFGLELAFGRKAVINCQNGGGHTNIEFYHCKIWGAGFPTAYNVGVFTHAGTNNRSSDWKFVNCKIGTSTQSGQAANSSTRYHAAFELYSIDEVKVDSCNVGLSGDAPLTKGFFAKGGTGVCPAVGHALWATTIYLDTTNPPADGACVSLYNWVDSDTVTNCVLIGGQAGVAFRNGGGDEAECYPYRCFIGHNVFAYQTAAHVVINVEPNWPNDSCGTNQDSTFIFGNVGYGHEWDETGYNSPTRWHGGYGQSIPPDSCQTEFRFYENHWYDGNNTLTFVDTGLGVLTWTQWKALGMDAVGDTVDPQFDSAIYRPGDAFLAFARTAASNDIASPLTIRSVTFNKAGISPAASSATKMRGWKP